MEEEKKLEQSYQKPEQIKNTPSGHTGKGLCVALCIVFLALGFLLSSLYYEHRYKDLSPLAEAMEPLAEKEPICVGVPCPPPRRRPV